LDRNGNHVPQIRLDELVGGFLVVVEHPDGKRVLIFPGEPWDGADLSDVSIEGGGGLHDVEPDVGGDAKVCVKTLSIFCLG
jgi:hypothetical protein